MRRIAVLMCAVGLHACSKRDDVQDWIRETEQAARSRPQAEMPALPAAPVYTEPPPVAHAFDRNRLPEAFADGIPTEPPFHHAADGPPPEASAAHGWKYVGSIRSGKRFTALIEYRGRVYRVPSGGTVGSARLLSAKRETVVLQHKGRRITLPLARADRLPPAMPSAAPAPADTASRSAHTE